MKKIIKPVKRIFGEITVPGDKSIAHRAIMVGAIACGTTEIKGLPDSDDCNFTAKAFQDMGVIIKKAGDITKVEGAGLRGLKRPERPIYVGNSGTSMRLLAGILAGQDFEATLSSAEELSNRPMKRIVEPLSKMGVDISARDGKYPPLVIKGGTVKPVTYKLPVSSAQVKSAVLFAGLYSSGATTVIEKVKSRDHTERMLKYFGSRLKVEGLKVTVKGEKELAAKTLEIPGDISSASFFMVGSTLLEGSRITIRNVSINPTRAGILKILSAMGGRIKIVNKKRAFEPVADIIVEAGKTHGITIDADMIPAIIDELPIIFILAALSKGRTIINGAGELRVKETDRISSMEENLRAMGANIRIENERVIIDGVDKLHGAALKSFGDHRTCMAMAIAALKADGESEIEGVESVSKSYPDFFGALFSLTRV